MSSFEDRLMTSLSADDEAFLRDLESDAGLFQQVGAAFSGPMKYLTGMAVFMSFVIFLVSLWAGYNMLISTDLKHVVLWGALFGWTSLGVGLIKIWFWMRMNHLTVLRELKRIELPLVKDA